MKEYQFLKLIFHHFHAMKRQEKIEIKILGEKKRKKKRKGSHTALRPRAW